MEETKLYTARIQVVEAMEQGLPWLVADGGLLILHAFSSPFG